MSSSGLLLCWRAGGQKAKTVTYADVCGKCGARRVDRQLGLEPTPDQYVANIVAVFREVRRVLSAHGTCWVNLGDSYAQTSGRTDRKEATNESDGSRISGSETCAQTRPVDGGAQTGSGDASSGGGRSDDGSGAGAGRRSAGLVGRATEFRDRGRERGYNPDSNFANYGGRIGEARSTVVGGLKPKDLCGIPWRVAFALQADGWYLRSDIVWSKSNPMPESVTDRPTKAHEYVFLLSRGPRYFFDQEAVREPWGDHGRDDMRTKGVRTGTAYLQQGPVASNSAKGPDGRRKTSVRGANGSIQHRDGDRWPNGGRNIRSVWTIATQPYAEAHFATYPEALVERCLKAGCPEWVCETCGKARERITSTDYDNPGNRRTNGPRSVEARDDPRHGTINSRGSRLEKRVTTEGWSDCGHGQYRPGIVLDPFMGSGTTALVARRLGRHAIGIELNEQYAALCARRLQQLSLLAEGTA